MIEPGPPLANEADTFSLQYPIGTCPQPTSLSAAERTAAVESIAALPQQLADALNGLHDTQLDTACRPGAWTIRTLVHHLADCHLIAYTWTRLAITSHPIEHWPMVFDYNVDSLAKLADSSLPAATSLDLLGSLHQRWVTLLHTMSANEFNQRGYTHPETGRCSLDQMLAMYAWHSRHHLAQIMHCRDRNGW